MSQDSGGEAPKVHDVVRATLRGPGGEVKAVRSSLGSVFTGLKHCHDCGGKLDAVPLYVCTECGSRFLVSFDAEKPVVILLGKEELP